MKTPSQTAIAGSEVSWKIPIQKAGSLYFHVPFCTKKCPYCHFYVLPNRSDLRLQLMEALYLEWQQKLPLLQDTEIVSIYFGGGTPALLGPQPLHEVLSWVGTSCRLSPDCEITLEVNPEETSLSLFSEFFSLGINRLSFGVQSLDDVCLQQLHRTHTAGEARQALTQAHDAGFRNLSIDLMTEIPGQTRATLLETLRQIQELPIHHLSLYNLTIEPNTPFARREKQLRLLIPRPEECFELLQLTVAYLEQIGLSRYEISAFGRPSRHNIGYWTARPFLGFGPSAFSYWNNQRIRNIPHLKKYHELLVQGLDPSDFEESLPFPRNFQELLAVRLRLIEGADPEAIAHSLQAKVPSEINIALQKLQRVGWLTYTAPYWKMTEQGRYFYDSIAEELV